MLPIRATRVSIDAFSSRIALFRASPAMPALPSIGLCRRQCPPPGSAASARALAHRGRQSLARDGSEAAVDRRRSVQSMDKLGLAMAISQTAETLEEAKTIATELIGNFPIIIRPAFTLGGTGGGIAYNWDELETIVTTGLDASMTNQVCAPLMPTRCAPPHAKQVCAPLVPHHTGAPHPVRRTVGWRRDARPLALRQRTAQLLEPSWMPGTVAASMSCAARLLRLASAPAHRVRISRRPAAPNPACLSQPCKSASVQVLVEQSLLGWKEYELEVMRDLADNVVIICSIENVDPMGVHTGDSITVAPQQTLTDKEYQRLRDASVAIIREMGVECGGSNVQLATDPETGARPSHAPVAASVALQTPSFFSPCADRHASRSLG